MRRRVFLSACCSSLALLSLSASDAAADRWEFRIKKQGRETETVVIHSQTRLAAEKKLRNDHPNCVILDVKHTKK